MLLSPKKSIVVLASLVLFVLVKRIVFNSSSDSLPVVEKISLPSDEKSVNENIELIIKTFPVVIFSKSFCPFSRKAKDVLSKYKLSVEVKIVELDLLSNGNAYQDRLEALTGARTVPRVFIGSRFIGGGDETADLDRQGRLRTILEEARLIVS